MLGESITFTERKIITQKKQEQMGLQSDPSPTESVIVVMDANRNKGIVDALDWALKHVVRPKDTVVVLGVLCEIGKKNSCFPNMGISISGIWEKLDFSGQGEVNPRELGEEIERKIEQYQSILQPFYRQCKRNEVKLEVKLAAGLCPLKITVEEAQKSSTRWIVLDRCHALVHCSCCDGSHLKKYRLFIYRHVRCNIAAMKGKDVATLMPSKPLQPENSPTLLEGIEDANIGKNQLENLQYESLHASQEGKSSWYPLSLSDGYPREFQQSEVDVITNGFAEENIVKDDDNIKVYEGVLQQTPLLVMSFLENDDRFWLMLMILSRVRHRNIMSLVGYCCTGASRCMLFELNCLVTIETILQRDDSARNLPWKTRWYIALEIGGSLRYLHEECADEPIVHLSVCSSNIVLTHDCSAMLCNFLSAKWLEGDVLPSAEDSLAECSNIEENKCLLVDVHDYGTFLIELLSGRSACSFPAENMGQSLIDWALPLLENGSLNELMDPRVVDTVDSGVVNHMAHAALLCLKSDSGRSFSISEVLAVVRGDKLAASKR